jgi:hypothetical protein
MHAMALLAALCVLAGFADAQQYARGSAGTPFVPGDETPEQFPPGPNREDAFYFCTACHGFKLVASQGMSRQRWDESLTMMTARHNMPNIEGQQREKILEYLASAFPERRQPGGWRNPFLPQ